MNLSEIVARANSARPSDASYDGGEYLTQMENDVDECLTLLRECKAALVEHRVLCCWAVDDQCDGCTRPPRADCPSDTILARLEGI